MARPVGSRNRVHAGVTPWLTTLEAADRAKVGIDLIYAEVKARRLQAARIGFRRNLRFLPEWIDAWLEASCTPVLLKLERRG